MHNGIKKHQEHFNKFYLFIFNFVIEMEFKVRKVKLPYYGHMTYRMK